MNNLSVVDGNGPTVAIISEKTKPIVSEDRRNAVILCGSFSDVTILLRLEWPLWDGWDSLNK